MPTTYAPVRIARADGAEQSVAPRWRGVALAVHPPIVSCDAKPARGKWVISGHVHGLSAGVFLGPLRDAIALAKAWDAAFAAALPPWRDTAPNLSQWEHSAAWGRQLRRDEPPTGPGYGFVARERITAADGDGGEQWEPVLTVTPGSKPKTARFSRVLANGRERLRCPVTGKCLRMNGDTAAFKGPNPLQPIYRLFWNGQWLDVPTIAELMAWSMDGICETPDGSRVEPDAPDAWLSLLGIV